jgi:hypothetical protein
MSPQWRKPEKPEDDNRVVDFRDNLEESTSSNIDQPLDTQAQKKKRRQWSRIFSREESNE